MSADTHTNVSDPVSHLGRSKPNETRKGQATVRNGNITPEGTPAPDSVRIEADERRREEEERTTSDDGGEFSTTRRQPPDPDEETGNRNASDKGTDVLQEVLKCGKEEHRRILGLRDSYADPYEEEEAILDALWERGMKTHPKYNKDKNAEKAFTMILDAAAVLDVGEQSIEEMKDWSGPGDDEDRMDGVENDIPWPTKKIVEIYEKATPHIAQLQKNPKSKAAAKVIDGLNNEIKQLNEKDEIDPLQWVIDYQELAGIYQKVKPFIDRLQRNAADVEAKQEIDKLNNALDDIIKKHKYPKWHLDPDIAMKPNQRAAEKPKEAAAKPKESTQTQQPVQAQPAAKKSAAPAAKPGWRAGLTEKSERILAMAPHETTDILGKPVMTRCLFVVEKKGQKNPIAFEDSADVGDKASKGYIEDLPKNERIDVRSKSNNFSPKDRQGFLRIKGVASLESMSGNRFPNCVVWGEWENGVEKFANRSGWRNIWKSKADRMIEDFFTDNRLKIPWEKRAKRPASSTKDESRTRRNIEEFERRPARRDRELARKSVRGRGRDSERSRSRSRRRSSSVSSSASSYLASDPGQAQLERLEEEIEDVRKTNQEILAYIRSQRDVSAPV